MAHKIAIVGGGAAGFFSAIELKKMHPEAEVTIFERSKKVLAKVEVSGGGRCNCTNSFAEVKDLKQVYPRGYNLLKRLFKQFGPKEAYQWFEEHGVPLVTQEDQCVFPKAQDSHVIIDCFVREARRQGVKVMCGYKVQGTEPVVKSIKGVPNGKDEEKDGKSVNDERGNARNTFTINGETFDYLIVTTGGMTYSIESSPLSAVKEHIIPPVPSLFTFSIKDRSLHELMGTVVENTIVSIPGTKFKAEGALLITHWGMSGPAILKLSSHAARHMYDEDYKVPLLVNWTGEKNADTVKEYVLSLTSMHKNKMLSSYRPFDLQQRLWDYLTDKLGKKCRWGELGNKDINKLVDLLCNDKYDIADRYAFKDEFVTCGGISLDAIDKNSMECKYVNGLFFAGEVLDVDGVTGGFNFQAAWSTAYAAAHGISKLMEEQQ